jgi:putative aldouronate transport system permease protein
MDQTLHQSAKKKRPVTAEGIVLLAMALPFMLVIVAFSYVPLHGWLYAFFNYKLGQPLSAGDWAGLKYFMATLTDPGLYGVLLNTFAISILGLLGGLVPVVFAIMLSEVRSQKFLRFVQTATTFPYFISWVLVYAFMYAMFSSEGAMNTLVHAVNPAATSWLPLSDERGAWYFQTFVGIWKYCGWTAIIYLAAILGIDTQLYEAATIDGAGTLQKIKAITIPGISETFLVLLLLSVASILSNGFEQFYVFYNPMVARRLDVLDYYIYRIGFRNLAYSYATAVSVYKSALSVFLLFFCNLVAKRVRGASLF